MEIRVWEREVARLIQADVDEKKRVKRGKESGGWCMYIYQADILVSLVFVVSLLPVFFTYFSLHITLFFLF